LHRPPRPNLNTNPSGAAARHRKATTGKHGGKAGPGRGKKTGDNSTRFKGKGRTSRAYILARLDRDGLAELAARVRAGEISANAAAIEASSAQWSRPFVNQYVEAKMCLSAFAHIIKPHQEI
jgi:hypothetical protein